MEQASKAVGDSASRKMRSDIDCQTAVAVDGHGLRTAALLLLLLDKGIPVLCWRNSMNGNGGKVSPAIKVFLNEGIFKLRYSFCKLPLRVFLLIGINAPRGERRIG